MDKHCKSGKERLVGRPQKTEDKQRRRADQSPMDVGDDGSEAMEVECPTPGALGLVTRVVPMRPEEAQSSAARAAVDKELKNILDKHVFDHERIYYWAVVRASEPTASIGTAMMILGCKNDELSDEAKVHKGRLVFQGNRAQSASGCMVFGAPDDLYGKPVDLCLARMVMSVALLRDWRIEAGDIEGAYLNAPLRGPPI